MSETTNVLNTSNIRRTRPGVARRAGLLLVASAGALVMTGGLAGTATALTPPQPLPPLGSTLVGPIVLNTPLPPVTPRPPLLRPGVVGPIVLNTPLPPLPPHRPNDLTNGEDGPGDPGVPGPNDLTNGEDGPGDPGVPGPDDLTNGEDGPGDPGVPGPDDLTTGTADPDPEPDPESDPAPEGPVETTTPAENTTDDDAAEPAASSLAFTGGELSALAVGLALLGSGGVAAAVGVSARRRPSEEI